MTANIPLNVGLLAFNAEPRLEETLGSVLTQTMSDFSLTISDNGSTDGTEEMCREFASKDSRVRYIRHEVNRGAVWNFNFLATEATSPYFAWKSDDDLWDAPFLERCLGRLKTEPAAVVSFCAIRQIDKRGAGVAPYSVPPADVENARVWRRAAAAFRLEGASQIYGVLDRAALMTTDLMTPCWGLDNRLLLQLALRGRSVIDPEVLYAQRVRGPETIEHVAGRFTGEGDAPVRTDDPFLSLYAAMMLDVTRAPLDFWEKARCFAWVYRTLSERDSNAGRMARGALSGGMRTSLEHRQLVRLIGLAGLRTLIDPTTPLLALRKLRARRGRTEAPIL